MIDDLEVEDPFEHPDDHQSSSRYPYDDRTHPPHQSLHSNDVDASEPVSWQAPWPIDGVLSSTIFKYLQHDGLMRENGNSTGLVRAINEIPHLDITSDDRDDTLIAWFTNMTQYRVSASDIEFISAMQKGTYTLKTLDNAMLTNLEISDEVLK
jgi:hypothetical protein